MINETESDPTSHQSDLLREVEELRRQIRLQQAVNDVSRELAEASLRLDDVLDTITRRVADLIGDLCLIRFISDDRLYLDQVALAHPDAERLELVRELLSRSRQRIDEGLQGEVIRTGQAVFIPSTTPEQMRQRVKAEFVPWFERYGMYSVLILPLRVRGELIGTIGTFRDRPGQPYIWSDRRLLQDLADRAALAIGNARLYERAETAEAYYRTIFDGVADAIIVIAPQGHYLDANPAAAALYGYSQEELRQMRAGDLTDPEHHPPGWAWERYRSVRPGVPLRLEATIRRKDGQVLEIDGTTTAVVLPDGSLVYVNVARDISERRRVERIQQEFLSMVTHDLKTPLASIRGHTQLIARRENGQNASTQAIVEQVDRLHRLVDELLDVVQLDAGQLKLETEPLDLVALANTAIEQARGLSDRHQFRLEAGEAPVEGRWDQQRLSQVFQNLLSNAIKYSPDGGEIAVSIEAEPERVIVSVRDHGIGIAAEDLPRLFNRFSRLGDAQQSRPPGLGLGLFITRSLIEAHGGWIWVESKPGRGSNFRFALPYAPPTPRRPPASGRA